MQCTRIRYFMYQRLIQCIRIRHLLIWCIQIKNFMYQWLIQCIRIGNHTYHLLIVYQNLKSRVSAVDTVYKNQKLVYQLLIQLIRIRNLIYQHLIQLIRIRNLIYQHLIQLIRIRNHMYQHLIQCIRFLFSHFYVILTDVPEEVKYKYALLDVFGDDCFPIFINILQVGKTSNSSVYHLGCVMVSTQLDCCG